MLVCGSVEPVYWCLLEGPQGSVLVCSSVETVKWCRWEGTRGSGLLSGELV